MASKADSKKNNGAVIGFEAKLWLAADKFRNNMHAVESEHVALGLIFFSYISDKFEEHHSRLGVAKGDGANFLQSRTFAVLRETILPKLLSGEVLTGCRYRLT